MWCILQDAIPKASGQGAPQHPPPVPAGNPRPPAPQHPPPVPAGNPRPPMSPVCCPSLALPSTLLTPVPQLLPPEKNIWVCSPSHAVDTFANGKSRSGSTYTRAGKSIFHGPAGAQGMCPVMPMTVNLTPCSGLWARANKKMER